MPEAKDQVRWSLSLLSLQEGGRRVLQRHQRAGSPLVQGLRQRFVEPHPLAGGDPDAGQPLERPVAGAAAAA
ncbi:hypothetical protein VTK73DRAFT_3818 [Phialemonium thermophilum]|uniref:Uncharacterized protein n=1 Tax=Phialemonium thermophilum TaxID=223376 RepID=A0ABR3VEQ3_9PEZI